MRVRKTKSPMKFTDPVCGMPVDSAHSHYVFIYQKKAYYFCGDACLKSFRKDPVKFQKYAPVKPKNWWCRYTARLEKATGGKAFKCH